MVNDNQPKLANRVAMVTGAASGMRIVMARSLAAAGARIAAVDVSAAGLAALTAEPLFAGNIVSTVADVSRAQDCARAVDQAAGAFGTLDILINCAGVSMGPAAQNKHGRIKFFEADPDGWQRVVTINALGAFLMARYAAPPIVARLGPHHQRHDQLRHHDGPGAVGLRRREGRARSHDRDLGEGPRRHRRHRQRAGAGRTDGHPRVLPAGGGASAADART